jgi:hypothetical protein
MDLKTFVSIKDFEQKIINSSMTPYFSQNGGGEKSCHFKKNFRLILFGRMSNFSGAFIHWGKGDEREGGGKEPLANGTQYR